MSSSERVTCNSCGRQVWTRRTDGRLRTHDDAMPWMDGRPPTRCPGSGAMPVADDMEGDSADER